ncbi:MAG: hypothetical protein RAP70_02375 [Candidatus Celaenobacter antarcticus]|nr:hypothetical protein [Candidatus Celaenobacter antarcticus]MDP8313900.1 hypothetical protein [Candidatus Celaenobacter antarcticus]
MRIGIRREDKSKWERRVALVPEHVALLKDKFGIQTFVQPSKIRIFPDEEYKKIGAIIQKDLSECPVVFGVKEMPSSFFLPGKTYVFFSHVNKGQLYNMPMLQCLMDLKCNLIDYEKIENEKGQRLIFFGRHAGVAGMVDSLWAYGQHLKYEGVHTAFEKIKKAYEYESVDDIKIVLKKIGNEIFENGLPDKVCPLVVGFTGYGNVSKGAQEILDCFPFIEITPEELISLKKKNISKIHLYKVVLKEKNIVVPKDASAKFELQDYFAYPEKYKSQFAQYIPHLTILMNCIYWALGSPRLVTKADLKELSERDKQLKLKVIGDVSCDIEGSIEITIKVTEPDNPSYIYDPLTDTEIDGNEGEGVIVVGRDNLPCEIPKDASTSFSEALVGFVPDLLAAHSTGKLNDIELPKELQTALILHNGDITKDYTYLKKFL